MQMICLDKQRVNRDTSSIVPGSPVVTTSPFPERSRGIKSHGGESMSLKLSRFVFLTLILVIAATFTSTALGQLNNDPTVEIGMKPYGSFEGGSIDSISTTNGNLNLHIPLVSYPQIGRKLHLGFDVTLSNGNYQYTPNTVPACTQQPNVCEYGTFDNRSFVRILPDFGLTADISGVAPLSLTVTAYVMTLRPVLAGSRKKSTT